MDCPPQCFVDKFGSPGTLRTMFVFGNSTWRYGVIRSMVSTRALSVVIDRCGNKAP